MFARGILLTATAAATLLSGGGAAMADCQVTVGLVMELTGPAGEYGQAGANPSRWRSATSMTRAGSMAGASS